MGDRSVLIELGDDISPAVNERVQRLFIALDRLKLAGVLDLIPGYRSLLVIHHPLMIETDALKDLIRDACSRLDAIRLPKSDTVTVPVVYGDRYGPDLQWVAQYHKISVREVIDLHTRPLYRVYMIGFTPGFPYLGEVPEKVATPRRKTPRTDVPRGSVGIAQRQSGIYPVDSPGGWQIIGWTPAQLFDPRKEPPSLLQMGGQVRFYEVSAEEAKQWQP
jgi:KipI family sensor histidine kinase inhibitor